MEWAQIMHVTETSVISSIQLVIRLMELNQILIFYRQIYNEK